MGLLAREGRSLDTKQGRKGEKEMGGGWTKRGAKEERKDFKTLRVTRHRMPEQ